MSKYLKRGIDAYYDGDYNTAQREIKTHIEVYGNNLESYFYGAIANYKQGPLDNEEQIENALKKLILDLRICEQYFPDTISDNSTLESIKQIMLEIQSITSDAEEIVQGYSKQGFEVLNEPINLHCVRLNLNFIRIFNSKLNYYNNEALNKYKELTRTHINFIKKVCFLNDDENEEIKRYSDKIDNNQKRPTTLDTTSTTTKTNSVTTTKEKSKINIVVLILLIIFFWPAAIVYYIIKKNKD